MYFLPYHCVDKLVEVDKLRFPTGTATAETILAMASEAGEAVAKARVLILAALFAGLFTLCSHFVPEVESPPIHKWLNNISWPEWGNVGLVVGVMATWSFKVYLGPSLMGGWFFNWATRCIFPDFGGRSCLGYIGTNCPALWMDYR